MAQGAGSSTLGQASPIVPKTKSAVPFGTKREDPVGAAVGPKQATLNFGQAAQVLLPKAAGKAKTEPKQAKLSFS